MRAERHADSDLACPLADRVSQDRVDSHAGHHQGQDSETARQQGDGSRGPMKGSSVSSMV